MAFAYTTNATRTPIGNVVLVSGSYTGASGDTGGSIETGLKEIIYANATKNVAAQGDLTVTKSGGTITLAYSDPLAAHGGDWVAIGRIK